MLFGFFFFFLPFFQFVVTQGCDGSVLLDDTSNFTGEKNAGPNRNSIRGFEFIDAIKSQIEYHCPSTVSCADLLALLAREAVNLVRYTPSQYNLLLRISIDPLRNVP